MMKKQGFLILLTFLGTQLMGQINGPSASKITSFNVIPVPAQEAELEPTWNYSRNVGSQGSDSINISTSVNWRMTYGLFEGAEVGLSTPSNFSSLCMGYKQRIYKEDKLAMAAMAGMGLNFQNGLVASEDNVLSYYAVGMIAAYDINPKNSIDANVQVYKNIGGTWNMQASADLGSYVIGEKFQLIFGASYNYSSISEVVAIYPGFAIEAADDFILVLAPAITLSGADANGLSQTFGIGLSFTSCWR